jgi:hypothetical protein
MLLVAGIGAYWRQASRIDVLNVQQEAIAKTLEALTGLLQTSARQDERIITMQRELTTLQQEVADLRRGRGFVQRDVDGLYTPAGRAPIP